MLNIRLAIAGRNPPGAAWEPLRRVTTVIALGIFTHEEANAFLDRYGITDSQRRQSILDLSRRLPLLMSWLTAPEGITSENDVPTQNIVERFLRWVKTPALQEVILFAAFPRAFNLDILTFLDKERKDKDSIRGQEAFNWLQTMYLVRQESAGWQYHSVVRLLLLDYQRQRSPQQYRHLHSMLAKMYDEMRHSEGDSPEQWGSEEWRTTTLSYLYHFLAAAPGSHWNDVLSLLVLAIHRRLAFALEIVESLSKDDLLDELTQAQKDFLQFTQQQLRAMERENFTHALDLFERFCGMPDLTAQAQLYAYSYRGAIYSSSGKLSEALTDLDRAVSLDGKYAWAVARRGEVYRLLGRYTEALVDLDRAIFLNAKYAWALANRGVVYGLLGRYPEALTDLDRALALDEKNAWALSSRGETYRQMGRYPEALAELDRALSSKEKNALDDQNLQSFGFACRGLIYLFSKKYEQALADLDHALALYSEQEWVWYDRALTHFMLGNRTQAMADIVQAIALAESKLQQYPDNYRVTFNLALNYLFQGDKAKATGLYDTLLSTGSALMHIPLAVSVLRDFLTLLPTHEAAASILARLEAHLLAHQSPQLSNSAASEKR